MNGVVEQVTLRVYIECYGCTRRLDTSETPPPDSVRTGNHTQRAAYWLEDMGRRILASATARRWEQTEKGWRCAHCTAADVDSLAKRHDPIETPAAVKPICLCYGRGCVECCGPA